MKPSSWMLQVLGDVEFTFPQDYSCSLNGPDHGQITTLQPKRCSSCYQLQYGVGKIVRCQCDNAAIVAAVRSGWCKNKHAMHLLRYLYFFQAAHQVKLMTEHIKGSHNELADATIAQNFYLCSTGARGSAPPPETSYSRPASRLDISSLEKLAFTEGLADSTHRTYSSAQNRYLLFCRDASLRPLPASETTLCHYMAYLARDNWKHSSIKAYLSVIWFLNNIITEGFGDPFLPLLQRLQFKRCEAEKGGNKKERLPMSPDILWRIKKVWDQKSSDHDYQML